MAGLDVVEEVRGLAAAGQGAEAEQPAGGLQQLHNTPGLQEAHFYSVNSSNKHFIKKTFN